MAEGLPEFPGHPLPVIGFRHSIEEFSKDTFLN